MLYTKVAAIGLSHMIFKHHMQTLYSLLCKATIACSCTAYKYIFCRLNTVNQMEVVSHWFMYYHAWDDASDAVFVVHARCWNVNCC